MILRHGKMSMQNTDKSIKKKGEKKEKQTRNKQTNQKMKEQNGSIKITLAETVQRPVWFP